MFPITSSAAVSSTAQVIDHYLGTAFGEFKGIGLAESAPAPVTIATRSSNFISPTAYFTSLDPEGCRKWISSRFITPKQIPRQPPAIFFAIGQSTYIHACSLYVLQEKISSLLGSLKKINPPRLMVPKKVKKPYVPSFRRRPESSYIRGFHLVWTTIFTGVTTFYDIVKIGF